MPIPVSLTSNLTPCPVSDKLIVAAAAMILVEECTLRLDDPVDPWLPELADRRVLRAIEGPLASLVAGAEARWL